MQSVLYENSDMSFQYYVTNTDDTELDITGGVTTMAARTYDTKKKIIGDSVELEITADIVTADEGRVLFTIGDTHTSIMGPGNFIYEIKHETSSGYAVVQERGFFKVEARVD